MTAATLERTGKDLRTIGLVGGGHFFSHFYLLALPPLFPILHAELGTSYTALGGLMSAYALAAGIGLMPVGFVVDRHGAAWPLIAGLTLLSGSVALMTFADSYWALLGLSFVAGLGNSVFHPADYAILNARVPERRLGRAFAAHTFSGYLGFAAAPLVTVALAEALGWRAALGLCGLAGLLMAAVLLAQRTWLDDNGHETARAAKAAAREESVLANLSRVLTPGLILLFGFFLVNAMTTMGIQAQSISSLIALYDLTLGDAKYGLTLFLIAAAAGVVAGGIATDKTDRYDLLTGAAFLTAAAGLGAIGLLHLPYGAVLGVMAMAGFLVGAMIPTRDMMVRAFAPPGAIGKVYGLMSVGIEVGAVAAPLIMGWFVDHAMPEGVFLACGVFLVGSFAASQIAARRIRDRSAEGGPA
ncbi:MAG: MFS transporter [Rhodospirillaceae bacterium]|jgi:MFS transporter, FSR family, fosmidomycin resistance protein|nr:MFS transporter [Rhodospirillaceae bacterium]MBT6118217.1 MFS transporter [Rhodospirillaceae bacterium]